MQFVQINWVSGPPIIECGSIAANDVPLLLIGSARVASATEGAAPKRPPKLLGLIEIAYDCESRNDKPANSKADRDLVHHANLAKETNCAFRLELDKGRKGARWRWLNKRPM
jgi:hypothetical protein